MPERHEMELRRTFPSGAQEWFCPECKRWMVLHHEPAANRLKTVVLEAGNEQAGHFGGTEGLITRAPQVQAGTEPPAGSDKGWLH